MQLSGSCGVLMTNNTMSTQANSHSPSPKGEDLERLLAKDAGRFPVLESPWFATRTTAMARGLPQQGKTSLFSLFSLRLRWMLPIPLAGVAAIALLTLQHLSSPSRTFTSSESEFEQHIEMLTPSDSSQDYLVSQ